MSKLLRHIFFMLIWAFPFMSQAQEIRPIPVPADSLAADSIDNDRVKILNADILMFQQVEGIPIQKLIGNVQIQQDSTFFFCDSAYHYESQNRLEAYSRVRIEMSDSVTLNSDKLIYYSDTKIAEVFDNISLTDQDAVLTSDRMTYYRVEDYGFYKEGGKLVDDDNVLTSQLGYYYPQDKNAFFKDSVVLVSPDYTLETDTLQYNTESKIAVFITETKILSADGEINTTNGNYYTESKKINLYERSTVQDSSYLLSADSLRYVDDQNMGYALGNVYIQEEDSTLEIRGQYGEFNRQTDESLVTQDPVAIQFMEDDTLYMFADTLLSLKVKKAVEPPVDSMGIDSLNMDSSSAVIHIDSLAQNTAMDSLNAAPLAPKPPMVSPTDSANLVNVAEMLASQDSTEIPAVLPPMALPDSLLADSTMGQKDSVENRVFRAYKNVRLYMSDMQGRADSLLYLFDDSVIYMYQKPVLWSEESQVSGDTIIIWMKKGNIDSMWVGPNAFMASKEDTVGFNQIKGKEMRVKFKDNEMYKLHVIGNTESIYFAKNEDDTTNIYYEGMNQALAQEMKMYFADNELQRIVFLSKPEGSFKPFFEVVFQENKLEGLLWRGEERPIRPNIFPVFFVPKLRQARPPDAFPTQQSGTSSSPDPEGKH